MISDIGIRLVLNSTADNDGKMGEKLNGGEYFPLYKMAFLLSHEKNDNIFFLFQRYRNCFLNLDILSTQNLSVCGENILENCKVVNGSTTFECTLDFTEGISTL